MRRPHLADPTPAAPDTQDGLLATYLAMCDYVGSPVRLPVVDTFMASFENNDKARISPPRGPRAPHSALRRTGAGPRAVPAASGQARGK
jgi:hypothetical protein